MSFVLMRRNRRCPSIVISLSILIGVIALWGGCRSPGNQAARLAAVARYDSTIVMRTREKMAVSVREIARIHRELTGVFVVVDDDVPDYILCNGTSVELNAATVQTWMLTSLYVSNLDFGPDPRGEKSVIYRISTSRDNRSRIVRGDSIASASEGVIERRESSFIIGVPGTKMMVAVKDLGEMVSNITGYLVFIDHDVPDFIICPGSSREIDVNAFVDTLLNELFPQNNIIMVKDDRNVKSYKISLLHGKQ